jgi:hypothetical protein
VAEPEIISPQEGARDDALKVAADKLHAGVDLWRQGRESCREGMLQAAAALAEAKALLPATQAFGKWCDENFPEIGKDDRAALIHFGKNLDKARQVLAATERSSPQLIYANEWKVEAEFLGDRKSTTLTFSTSRSSPKKASQLDPISETKDMVGRLLADGLTHTIAKTANALRVGEPR